MLTVADGEGGTEVGDEGRDGGSDNYVEIGGGGGGGGGGGYISVGNVGGGGRWGRHGLTRCSSPMKLCCGGEDRFVVGIVSRNSVLHFACPSGVAYLWAYLCK